MSRFGNIATGALLIVPIALGGCRPTKGTANPEDYFPLIQVALAGGETAAMIGRNEALKAKSFEGCVAAESLISAFGSSQEVVAGRLDDKIVIPAVEIDVSECLAIREADDVEEAAEESASLRGPVVLETQVAGYVAPAEGEEAPAEEEPAEEGTPEEEAPAEEAAPEEAPPAEEAAPEEEAPAEEAAALKGNPDVAALVEAIAGITVAAVLHYAARLKDANCKKGTAALGAVAYVGGMIKPIADEIAEPDGMVSVPSVVIDLSECQEE